MNDIVLSWFEAWQTQTCYHKLGSKKEGENRSHFAIICRFRFYWW